MDTDTTEGILKGAAQVIAHCPNALTVPDAAAMRMADMSSALDLCAIYFLDFGETGCTRAARKFSEKISTVSREATTLAREVPAGPERRSILECLLLVNMACTRAHRAYMYQLDIALS